MSLAHPAKWAGLRTFSEDRVPKAGFAADREHFFWLVGPGGYGFQTVPAMADIVVSGILGAASPERLPALGLSKDQVTPQRLLS